MFAEVHICLPHVPTQQALCHKPPEVQNPWSAVAAFARVRAFDLHSWKFFIFRFPVWLQPLKAQLIAT